MRLPDGTVTFLFTDVAGSTRLLDEVGPDAYAKALAEHRRVVREAVAAHGGVEVDTQGDSFFVAFPTGPGALAAAAEAQAALTIPVRMGVHTGTPLLAEEGYVGVDVNRAARIAAAGHGGQVLVSSSTRALAGGFELIDLGEHRFKDLAAAERVYQLGGGEHPPLQSLYRTNLPVTATPFLGRTGELRDAIELLTREDVRLLTFAGPGGAGKTRLALQAAAESAHAYPDGLWWVSLAQLRDPAFVLPAVARGLGLRDEPQRRLEDTVEEWLAGKQTLLLLDNAEHLLPDVAGSIAWLRDLQGPKVLVTSRERLRLYGEHVYPVPALDEPDCVALFLARARALDPTFVLTPTAAEVCRRLDGLPLAIELAAARTTLFTPEQLLERLGERLDLLQGGRDADPRQQTLRATIAWSYDLLTEAEQGLSRRLAVFSGGCTYETAEEVCGADADTLQSLLDKNLLRRSTGRDIVPRYWMLATIREFALSRLGAEIEPLLKRLAQWLAPLVEGAHDSFVQGDTETIARFNAELDTIRDVIEWAAENDRIAALRLLNGAMELLWDAGYRGFLLDRLKVLYRPDDPADLRKLTLRNLTLVAEPSDARRYAAEWLALGIELADHGAIAAAHTGAGIIDLREGDAASARRSFEQALDAAQAGGDEVREAYAVLNLAEADSLAGDYEAAEQRYVEAGERLQRAGLLASVAICKRGVAWVHAMRDDAARAAPALVEAIDLAERIQSRGGLAICLDIAALVAVRADPELAARLLGAADEVIAAIGAILREPDGAAERASAAVEAALGERAAELREEGRQLGLEGAVPLALAYIDSL